EGTAPEGTIITIYDDVLGFLGTTIVESGRWSFTTNPLNEGEYNLRVTYRDPVGNTTAPSDPAWTIIVDVTAPDAPVVGGVEDAAGNPLGPVTNNPNPVVVGTANPNEEGSVVEVRDQDGNVVGTGTINEDGDWRVVIDPALTEGEYELIAVIIDPAGNETEMTGDPIELEVDLTPPDAPEVIGIESGTGESIGDLTNDPNPVVIGTADPSEEGSVIEIRDQDGNVVGTGIVDEDGN
ncbi:Biofilm associated protein A, partial [Pantoea sp. B9002]|uniref:Ig-like domain-containing protein n=1 Tax=Pantoea sp. B9002 TaxID=2726979 RepID=UPI00179731C7